MIKLAEEAITRQQAGGWRTDNDAVLSYGSLAKVLALAGRMDLANEMSSAVLRALKENKNASPKTLAAATYNLGFARMQASALAEAETHFREAIQVSHQSGNNDWNTAMYKTWLGFALHEQKKYAEAEPVLKEAYSEWNKQLAAAPQWEQHTPLLIVGRLVSLYEALNKSEEVAKWKTISQQK